MIEFSSILVPGMSLFQLILFFCNVIFSCFCSLRGRNCNITDHLYINLSRSYMDAGCFEKQCYKSKFIQPFSQLQQKYDEDNVIYIGALMPRRNDSVFVAIDLALEHINRSPHILPGKTLKFIYSVTECNATIATKQLFDMYYFCPSKIVLFGAMCYELSSDLAKITEKFNYIQMSYTDTDPTMCKKTAFNNTFLSVPCEYDMNPVRLSILSKYNWTRVTTIYQEEAKESWHQVIIEDFTNKAIGYNISYEVQLSFNENNLYDSIEKLKNHNVHIIIADFDQNLTADIFCSAYHNQLFGRDKLWLIRGYHPLDTSRSGWLNSFAINKTNCTVDEFMKASNLSLVIRPVTVRLDNQTILSNMTRKSYYSKFRRKAMEHGLRLRTQFHSYAYDSIWVVALAQDKMLHNKSSKMPHELNMVDFEGLTGRFTYKSQNREGIMEILQIVNGEIRRVGLYTSHNGDFHIDNNVILWPENSIPIDRTTIEFLSINPVSYAIIVIIAIIGIAYAAFFMAINIRYRNHRYIKMSSPKMNNIIIVGCMTAYSSVIILGADSRTVPYFAQLLCPVRAGLLSIGFSLAFGGMFSKTWRVNSIFTNITATNKKVIKDNQLLLMVAGLLLVDIIILTVWFVFDPMHMKNNNVTITIDSKPVLFKTEFCHSVFQSTWLGVTYVYKGLLLMMGIMLAWRTRHVSIPALNDSKYIGISVYNVVLFCISGFTITLCLDKDKTNSAFYVLATFIIFGTTITIAVLFAPKLMAIRRDPEGNSSRVRATLKKTTNSKIEHSENSIRIRSLTSDNIELKSTLKELMAAISRHETQLSNSICSGSCNNLSRQESLLQSDMTNGYSTTTQNGNALRACSENIVSNHVDKNLNSAVNHYSSRTSFTYDANSSNLQITEQETVRKRHSSVSSNTSLQSSSSYEDNCDHLPYTVQCSIPSPFQASFTLPSPSSLTKVIASKTVKSPFCDHAEKSAKNKLTCDILEYI